MTRKEVLEDIDNILENIDGYDFVESSEYAFVLGYVTCRLEQLKSRMESEY